MKQNFIVHIEAPLHMCDKEVDRVFNDDNYYRVKDIAERTGLGKNRIYRLLRKLNILDNDNCITDFARNNNYAIDDKFYVEKANFNSSVPRLSVEGIKFMWRKGSRFDEFMTSFAMVRKRSM